MTQFCRPQPGSGPAPHHFHPGSTHSRARQPAVPPRPGSASPAPQHPADVQHRGAAQRASGLAPAAPEATANRGEHSLQDLEHSAPSIGLRGYTKHAKGSLLADTKSTNSCSPGAPTAVERQCNQPSSQQFPEPTQKEELASSFSSPLHRSLSHRHRLSCSPGFHAPQCPRATLKGCSTFIPWQGMSTQKSSTSAALAMGSAYLMGRKRDQDSYPPRQGGIDKRFGASRDQRGLL